MGFRKTFVLLAMLAATGCAGPRTAAETSEEYVEVENPAFTMAPDAPPTIWVPRRYVESGLPRGGEILKRGYEQTIAAPAPAPTPASASASVSTSASAVSPRLRIAIVPMGEDGAAAGLRQRLRSASFALVGTPGEGGVPSGAESLEERSAHALSLARGKNFNALVLVGTRQGKRVLAEVYDGMGGILLRRIEIPVSPDAGGDGASGAPVLSSALDDVAETVREVTRHLPWLCGIVAVEEGKVYINAGRESGIHLGQRLTIYRGGKGVKGLGFDPGSRIATVEVAGFVGPDGAYGTLREGEGVRVSDVAGIE